MFWGLLGPFFQTMIVCPEIKQKQPQDRKTIFETLSLPVAKMILSPVARQAPTKLQRIERKSGKKSPQKYPLRDQKNHGNQRRDRILRLSLRLHIGQFSPPCGAINDFLPKLHSKPGEKGKTSTGKRSKKSSGENAPKLQISVPCRGRTCPDHSRLFPDFFQAFGIAGPEALF